MGEILTPTITITIKVKKFNKLKNLLEILNSPPVWMFGRAQLQYFTWWPSAWTGNQWCWWWYFQMFVLLKLVNELWPSVQIYCRHPPRHLPKHHDQQEVRKDTFWNYRESKWNAFLWMETYKSEQNCRKIFSIIRKDSPWINESLI